jgi:hypothetical protein
MKSTMPVNGASLGLAVPLWCDRGYHGRGLVVIHVVYLLTNVSKVNEKKKTYQAHLEPLLSSFYPAVSNYHLKSNRYLINVSPQKRNYKKHLPRAQTKFRVWAPFMLVGRRFFLK